MISVKKIDTINFYDLVNDLFFKKEGYTLHALDLKYPNIFAQGYGKTNGKNSVIFEIKEPELSEFDLLNTAASTSQKILNEWPHFEKLFVIFRQQVTLKLKGEFISRLGNKYRGIIVVYDLSDIQKFVEEHSDFLRKYENVFNTWFEVYDHIAFFLDKHCKSYEKDWAQLFFNGIANSEFFKNNSSRFFQYNPTENQLGLDPIQIFASFNYTGISKTRRIEIINNLLAALGSIGNITESVDFEGIPSPIVRAIIYNRKVESQNEIWEFFGRIYSNKLNGLTDLDFKAIKKWRGIQIPSLTMFLFWISSENFLPLDVNTVNYLKTLGVVDYRAKNYTEYIGLCSKKEKLIKSVTSLDVQNVFRNIVKEAYSYYERKSIDMPISGSTQTLITQETGKKEGEFQLKSRLISSRVEQFKNFKIIAVRPKENTNESRRQRHIKNLKEGAVYCFYSAYRFEAFNDSEIEYDQKLDLDIYNYGELNISISAIVGMNGSGKSAIADVIYLVINRIAYEKILLPSKHIVAEEVYADIFIKSDKLYKISVGSKVELFVYEPNEINSKYIKTTIDSDGEKMFKKFDIESLCYSLVVNYSLYGLNSKITGPWINPLFEKNDSYQVPIVLNPKREEGIIDVNREDELAKSRLLMNLLEPKLINFEKNEIPALSLGAVPQSLEIKLDKEKIERKRKKYRRFTSAENIEIVSKALKLEDNGTIEFISEAKEYIYYKLISIAENYPQYKKFKGIHRWIHDSVKLNKYLQKLAEDSSHITFKLRQAINYIVHKIYNSNEKNLVINLSQSIKKIIENDSVLVNRTIDLIPPSFLKTNVHFVHGGNFDALSSGEKQQIYSINTIAYHLFNLKSVMVYENIYKYNSINVVFDEVELYFHPDLQRTYIRDLRDRILSLNLNEEKDINNINIIFITHSPFILSDIPACNVLMLKVDEVTKVSLPYDNEQESFGANVHDLLANEFFMKKGFMGEFAKEQINDLISHLIGEKSKIEWTKEPSRKFIEIIGEPFLKGDLLDLYHKKYVVNQNDVDREIELLQNRKKLFKD